VTTRGVGPDSDHRFYIVGVMADSALRSVHQVIGAPRWLARGPKYF